MNVMKCAVFIEHGKTVMYLQSWMLFLWALSLIDRTDSILPEDSAVFASDIYEPPSRQNDKFSAAEYPYVKGGGATGNGNKVNYPEDRFSNHYSGKQHCSARLEDALEQIRRHQDSRQKTFDLNGYSVHQQLKSVPYDLYVTDMRVRMPTNHNKWVRVDKCLFNPSNQSLDTRLVFNDLTISGKVNLLDDQVLRRQEELGSAKKNNRDACNMILRLRKAGIGFHTEPIRRDRGQFNVKTDSHFLEPGFISVYVYGCESKLREREDDEGLSREMEDIFLKGIRSLLMTYMQKELQPAIKETLMRNMGYTVSYG